LTKPKTLFSPAKSCKDGYRNYCKECQSLKKKEWYENNKEHVLNKTKEWHKAHPDTIKKTKAKWATKNKEYHLTYKRNWRKTKPEISRAQVNARRKKVRQNRPLWADIKAIRNFYLKCPPGYHVDHIIPLRGSLVSGLHTIENLQYLPAIENMSKGNKYALDAA
jgi:hypothetical protein